MGLHPDRTPKGAIGSLNEWSGHKKIVFETDSDGNVFFKNLVFTLNIEKWNYRRMAKIFHNCCQRTVYAGLSFLALSVVAYIAISLLVYMFGVNLNFFITNVVAVTAGFFTIASIGCYLAEFPIRLKWVKGIKTGIATDVPEVPKKALENLKTKGRLAILFETKEDKWESAPDPVLFEIIEVGGKDYFRPLIGYDMTENERLSLTPLE